MAKGMNCPACGHAMYAEREDVKDKGVDVYYKCRNGNCGNSLRTFEGK